MASGAWSKLFADVIGHPKTRILASSVGEDKALASLVRLWTSTTGKRPGGEWDDWEIDAVLGPEVVKALENARFIKRKGTTVLVCSWDEVMGSYKETLKKRKQRGDSPGTVPGHSGDNEGHSISLSPSHSSSVSSEGVQGEPKLHPLTGQPTSKTETYTPQIVEVFKHWRKTHPDDFLQPHGGLKEWSAIRCRIVQDGATVDQLKTAIDGIHRDPWWSDKLNLWAVVKDIGRVQKFAHSATAPPTETTQERAIRISNENLTRYVEQRKKTRDENARHGNDGVSETFDAGPLEVSEHDPERGDGDGILG